MDGYVLRGPGRRVRNAVLALALTGLAVAVVWFAVSGSGPRLLLAGVAVVPLAGVVPLAASVWAADRTVFTRDGVWMRPYPWDRQTVLVPWPEIVAMPFGRIRSHLFLHVVVAEPERYVTGGPLRRAILRGQLDRYGTPLQVWVGETAGPEVRAAVSRLAGRPVDHGPDAAAGTGAAGTPPAPRRATGTPSTPWTATGTPPASRGGSRRRAAEPRPSRPWLAATAGVGAGAAACWLVVHLLLAGPDGRDGGAVWSAAAGTAFYTGVAAVLIVAAVRFWARRHRWVLRVGAGLCTVAVAVVGLGVAAHEVWSLATAEPVTIRVESCVRSYNSAKNPVVTCSGTWTFADGRSGGGQVREVGRGDVGRDVTGWASGSSAAPDRTSWLSLPFSLAAAAILSATFLATRRL